MEMYILAQKHFGIRYSERAQSEMYEIITEEIDHLQKKSDRKTEKYPRIDRSCRRSKI